MSSKGQTLVELVMVVAVAAIVVGALVFATIASLRNAQFSKNQAQATKLAQEGLEKLRSIRDRNAPNSVKYDKGGGIFTSSFSELWSIVLTCPSNCYFFLDSLGILNGGTSANSESIAPNFTRQFQIEDDASERKKVTVVVSWKDISGSHQSRLVTILRKP